MKEISIVIPAYNEENNIEKTLIKYVNYFSKKLNFEIIVVMDGCNDGTFEIVDKLSKKHSQIKYITHPKKLGKGGGIIKGFKKAEANYIAFTDADGSTPPKEIHRLAKTIKEEDGAIGSRWSKGSIILQKESFLRRIASRAFNLLVKTMFGLKYKDTQCGAKIFKKYVINDIIDELHITNFAFDVDLLYQIKRKGYNIIEIPIEWSHDNFTELKLAKVIPSMFLSIIGLRMKHSPYWSFVPKSIVKTVYSKIKTI